MRWDGLRLGLVRPGEEVELILSIVEKGRVVVG